MLAIFFLLGGAIALPHDASSTTVDTAKYTTTIMVTVTQKSMAPLPSDPSLVCLTPSLPCIIDGIAIWPNSTSVPSFTLDPSGDSTAMSSSATSFSQTLDSSKSYGATSSGGSTITSTTSNSNSETTSSPAAATTSSNCSHNMSHILPPPEPTSRTTAITATVDQPSTAVDVPSNPEPTPSKQPTNEDDALHGPDTDHSSDEPKLASAAMLDQPFSNTRRSTTNTDTLPTLDPIAWAGISKRSSAPRSPKPFWSRIFVAGSPQSPVQLGRGEEDKDDFSAGNEPENMCVRCDAGGDIVCIGERHYGFCDEGCAEPRVLGAGRKCVGGRVFGAREWSG